MTWPAPGMNQPRAGAITGIMLLEGAALTFTVEGFAIR
jgi:hypothetical protein